MKVYLFKAIEYLTLLIWVVCGLLLMGIAFSTTYHFIAMIDSEHLTGVYAILWP